MKVIQDYVIQQMYKIIGARSEEWRLNFCMRTCISAAVLAFLYLFEPTKSPLVKVSDPSFAAFVVVVVKDVTLGASLLHSWTCIYGSFIASIISLIIYTILLHGYGGENHKEDIPIELVLFFLFISVLLMQYFEIQLLGKKVGVSLLAINICSMRLPTYSTVFLWKLFIGVVIGTGCGIVGCILPWPRLAGIEVKDRMRYYSSAISALLQNVSLAWSFQSLQSLNHEVNHHDNFDFSTLSTSFISPREKLATIKSKNWRKIFIILQAIMGFKRSYKYHLGWMHKRYFFAKDRYIRIEFIKYLEDELDTLLKRANEATFGPSRKFRLQTFPKYMTLLRNFLMILSLLEKQVIKVEDKPIYHYIYIAFFKLPFFRKAFHEFIESIVRVIKALTIILVEKDSLASGEKEADYLIKSMGKLIQTRKVFDKEYFRARYILYYSKEAMHQPYRLTSTDNLKRFLDVHMHQETEKALPLISDVLFNMNCVIFYFETICDQLTTFWSVEELVELSDSINARYGLAPDMTPSKKITTTNYFRLRIMKFYRGLMRISTILFPNQLPWLGITWNQEKDKYEFSITPAMIRRFKASLVVALAMLLASIYGFYAKRPQISLAAFTIAYLAGGTVSGVNIITCINRAVGTVVACVYVIIVVFVYNSYVCDTTTKQNVFIGFALVLFQIPSTYVRSYALYSYSGIVAGFTVALLLLSPDLTTNLSVNRIIDTFVGVVIYLGVELLLFAQFSESFLIQDMLSIVQGIDRRFSHFHSHFDRFQQVANKLTLLHNAHSSPSLESLETPSTKATLKAKVDSIGAHISKLSYFRRKLSLPPQPKFELNVMYTFVKRQRDLIPFYYSEPKIMMIPPPFPSRLLQEGLHWQEQAMKSLQVMYWVVEACDGSRDFNVENMISFINFQLSQLNPTLQPTPQQISFANSISSARYTNLTNHPNGIKTFQEIYEQYYNHHRSSVADLLGPPEMLTDAHGKNLPPHEPLPDFEAILLPLRTQFEEVERFVSTSLSFLSLMLHQLQTFENKEELNSKTARKNPIESLAILNHKRFEQLLATHSHDRETPVLNDQEVSHSLSLYFGEIESRELEKLFDHYSEIIHRFQHASTERFHEAESDILIDNDEETSSSHQGMFFGGFPLSDSDGDRDDSPTEDDSDDDKYGTGVEGIELKKLTSVHKKSKSAGATPKPARKDIGFITSNKEIKIANTLISSTYDLITALRGLAKVIGLLQASRDIRMTQNATMSSSSLFKEQDPYELAFFGVNEEYSHDHLE